MTLAGGLSLLGIGLVMAGVELGLRRVAGVVEPLPGTGRRRLWSLTAQRGERVRDALSSLIR